MRSPPLLREFFPGPGYHVVGRGGGLNKYHRVGIDLEDAGHGTDTEAFRQRRDRPHQRGGLHLLALTWGARGFQEVAAATQAYKLSPPSPIGMPVGADITPAHPAVIRTGGLRAEMPGGIDVAVTA